MSKEGNGELNEFEIRHHPCAAPLGSGDEWEHDTKARSSHIALSIWMRATSSHYNEYYDYMQSRAQRALHRTNHPPPPPTPAADFNIVVRRHLCRRAPLSSSSSMMPGNGLGWTPLKHVRICSARISRKYSFISSAQSLHIKRSSKEFLLSWTLNQNVEGVIVRCALVAGITERVQSWFNITLACGSCKILYAITRA